MVIKNIAQLKRYAIFFLMNMFLKNSILIVQCFSEPFVGKIEAYFDVDVILVDQVVFKSSSFSYFQSELQSAHTGDAAVFEWKKNPSGKSELIDVGSGNLQVPFFIESPVTVYHAGEITSEVVLVRQVPSSGRNPVRVL